MNNTWNEILSIETKSDYYCNSLAPSLREEYSNYHCFPAKENIFKAFEYTNGPSNIRVVIIGQDPYYNEGLANGLAFGINENCDVPSSLNNIFSEIYSEYGQNIPNDYEAVFDNTLELWAKQGVLLLNTIFSVRKGEANSHRNLGWEMFSEHILEHIIKDTVDAQKPLVFMLWGKYAKGYAKVINAFINESGRQNVLILESSHPSGRSANLGFLGCGHFKKCNEFLKANECPPIAWFIMNKKFEDHRFDKLSLYIPHSDYILQISKGENDLEKEDIDNGFCDYIYYSATSLNDLSKEVDGGTILLKDNIENLYNDIFDCIEDVLVDLYNDKDVEYIVLTKWSNQ